jgi:hypothetical protein
VDYDARLDGNRLALSAGESSTAAISTQSGGYVAHDLEVTIGDADNKRAGIYKDVLTIVIQAAFP